MTDKKGSNDSSGAARPRESGSIIDAAAHRRPRVHGPEGARTEEATELDFLRDIPVRVPIILGETTMSLGEVIALEAGSVVQLDKLSGDPIDIYVENQKLGKGEVVVLHEKIRIRLLEITPPSQSWKESKTQNMEEE
jgi:flagellar motor switch protein FliN/FliY